MGGWPKGARCDVHVDAEFLRFWIGDARQPVPTPTGSIPLAAKIDCGTGNQNIGGRRQVQRRAHSRAVDRGDRRQRAVRDRKDAVIDSVQTILGCLARAVRSAPARNALPVPATMSACKWVGLLGAVDGRAQGRADFLGVGHTRCRW